MFQTIHQRYNSYLLSISHKHTFKLCTIIATQNIDTNSSECFYREELPKAPRQQNKSQFKTTQSWTSIRNKFKHNLITITFKRHKRSIINEFCLFYNRKVIFNIFLSEPAGFSPV